MVTAQAWRRCELDEGRLGNGLLEMKESDVPQQHSHFIPLFCRRFPNLRRSDSYPKRRPPFVISLCNWSDPPLSFLRLTVMLFAMILYSKDLSRTIN